MERIHTEQPLSLHLTESYKGVTKTNLNILPGSQESFSLNELYEKSKKFEDELKAEENDHFNLGFFHHHRASCVVKLLD